MAAPEKPSSAPEPTGGSTSRVQDRATTKRIVKSLLADPNYQARIEEAQADQDAGNLRLLEDVQDMLGIPHAPSTSEGAEAEFRTPEGWEDAEPIEELQRRNGLPTIDEVLKGEPPTIPGLPS
jgi:HEAT repeat protein